MGDASGLPTRGAPGSCASGWPMGLGMAYMGGAYTGGA